MSMDMWHLHAVQKRAQATAVHEWTGVRPCARPMSHAHADAHAHGELRLPMQRCVQRGTLKGCRDEEDDCKSYPTKDGVS